MIIIQEINSKENLTIKPNDYAFYQNVDYIKNNNDGTLLFLENSKYQYDYSVIHFINYICLINITSLKTYNKAINRLYNFKYNNPLVLNNIILLQTGNINSYETKWINYKNIEKIESIDDKTLINFYSKNQLIIDKPIKYFNNQINKISKLKRYLYKL